MFMSAQESNLRQSSVACGGASGPWNSLALLASQRVLAASEGYGLEIGRLASRPLDFVVMRFRGVPRIFMAWFESKRAQSFTEDRLTAYPRMA